RVSAIRMRALNDPHGGLAVGVRPAGAAESRGHRKTKKAARHLKIEPLNDLRSAARPTSTSPHGTKKAAHRVSAIRMRALNDPHQSSFPTVQTVTPLTRCACQPTIRHHPPRNFDSCSKGYPHLR